MGFTLLMESEYWYMSLCLLGYLLHFHTKSKFIVTALKWHIPYGGIKRTAVHPPAWKSFFQKIIVTFEFLSFNFQISNALMHCLLCLTEESYAYLSHPLALVYSSWQITTLTAISYTGSMSTVDRRIGHWRKCSQSCLTSGRRKCRRITRLKEL